MDKKAVIFKDINTLVLSLLHFLPRLFKSDLCASAQYIRRERDDSQERIGASQLAFLRNWGGYVERSCSLCSRAREYLIAWTEIDSAELDNEALRDDGRIALLKIMAVSVN